MLKKMQKGMTLMSVLIATALSAIIGLMVIRLMINQAEAMQFVELREKREHLLKHYRELVISEWDRSGGGITSKASRQFDDDDMYGTTSNSEGWWKVSAILETTSSGWIQHSDVYNAGGTDSSSGLHREDLKVVRLSITFDPKKHPVLKTKLAKREEYIFIGSRYAGQNCRTDERTRLDTSSDPNKSLYHPDSHGAIVSYSLHSNYAKCSQVPLIENKNECPPVSGWLGFESRGTGDSDNPFYRRVHGTDEHITGRIACSYPESNDPNSKSKKWHTAISAKGGPWYRLGRTLKDDGSVGEGGDKRCYDHDLSYIDKVTKIRDLATGTGGGELLCEPTLIAPQVFKHYYDGVTPYDGTTGTPSIAGSALGSWTSQEWSRKDEGQPGPLDACKSYRSYDGSTNKTYDDHVGGGGYKDDHSGGLKRFVSTGSGSGARTDPFNKQPYSRGVPGDRGAAGECECGNP